MEVQEITKTLFVGAYGSEYETRAEAVKSIAEAVKSIAIAEIANFLNAASHYREYDTEEGAKAIIENWAKIAPLVKALEAAKDAIRQ